MARAVLSLGSNLGDRAGQLARARQALQDASIMVQKATQVLETKAVIKENQPDFLNQLLAVETDLGPQALLFLCKALEKKLGRTAGERYGPRQIDIDIISYEEMKLDSPALQLPHPGLKDRAYLKELMTELITA
jgi:2-amino-4-hydroxy-6-hydroxymethyldihydropteridine diphosphokinase